MSNYKRDEVTTPKLSGTPLRLFVSALESPLRNALLGKMLNDSGLGRFRKTSAEGAPPLPVALPNRAGMPQSEQSPEETVAALLSFPQTARQGHVPETTAQFAKGYRQHETTPLQVAHRVVDAIKKWGKGDGSLHCFIASDAADILKQAEESEARFQKNEPLSVLDGVPVAVKDEMDQAPYPTTVGTSFLGQKPAQEDATLVARLRAAGALLIGKTNMHEVGINPLGLNPHHGAARNPFHTGRITGGSSSGSAAAVAAGLCPIAIGADGGGSIRIPASLCGVVGLKATFGRISEKGVYPLCHTVGHVGPMGATVSDVAAAYAFIAGFDAFDASTREQPLPTLEGLTDRNLAGLRLGISAAYFRDADAAVVKKCEEAVDILVRAGATVVEIPAPDLNTVLWTHATLILTEMAHTLGPAILEDVTRFGLDVRTNLAIGQSLRSTDYVHALSHRHLMTKQYLDIMREVDVVVTPTTAMVAPEIPESVLPEGQSDLKTTDALMRFARIANITGFPALTVPVGYGDLGLPVGLQLMARPWEENLLLRLGLVLEDSIERHQPSVSVTLLQKGRVF